MSSALLLIDLQNDYFPGGKLPLVEVEAAALQAQSLLNFFRQKHWPIVHIQHIAKRAGATFFLPDTAGAEIHPLVKPLAEEKVIIKHFPNSFRETGLLEYLQAEKVKKLVICGAMSHMCIDATTRAGFDLSFECTVIHDACATRNLAFNGHTVQAEDVHAAYMAALQAVYAKVISLQEFQNGSI